MWYKLPEFKVNEPLVVFKSGQSLLVFILFYCLQRYGRTVAFCIIMVKSSCKCLEFIGKSPPLANLLQSVR